MTTHGIAYKKDRDRWQVYFRKLGGRGEYIWVGSHKTKEGAMDMYDDYIINNRMYEYKLNRKTWPVSGPKRKPPIIIKKPDPMDILKNSVTGSAPPPLE